MPKHLHMLSSKLMTIYLTLYFAHPARAYSISDNCTDFGECGGLSIGVVLLAITVPVIWMVIGGASTGEVGDAFKWIVSLCAFLFVPTLLITFVVAQVFGTGRFFVVVPIGAFFLTCWFLFKFSGPQKSEFNGPSKTEGSNPTPEEAIVPNAVQRHTEELKATEQTKVIHGHDAQIDPKIQSASIESANEKPPRIAERTDRVVHGRAEVMQDTLTEPQTIKEISNRAIHGRADINESAELRVSGKGYGASEYYRLWDFNSKTEVLIDLRSGTVYPKNRHVRKLSGFSVGETQWANIFEVFFTEGDHPQGAQPLLARPLSGKVAERDPAQPRQSLCTQPHDFRWEFNKALGHLENLVTNEVFSGDRLAIFANGFMLDGHDWVRLGDVYVS